MTCRSLRVVTVDKNYSTSYSDSFEAIFFELNSMYEYIDVMRLKCN